MLDSKANNIEEHLSLCEALDRVLHKGVVLQGEVIISVADVDLIYLGLRVLLASVDAVAQDGAAWPLYESCPRENDPRQSARARRPAAAPLPGASL